MYLFMISCHEFWTGGEGTGEIIPKWLYDKNYFQVSELVLGGSSHLVSGLVHPSYKWTLPPQKSH